jgi:hypothetical protein
MNKKRTLQATLLITALFLSVAARDVLGQAPAGPTRTQCKQWDDAYLSMLNLALLGTLLGSCVLSLSAGVLGKFSWFFTAPRRRIIVVTAACLILVVTAVALGPWVVGLGRAWFSGVDPRYFDCASVQFGAEGLMLGWVGGGVPVIAQIPNLIIALCAAAFLGGSAALLISEVVNRSRSGISAKVREEGA